MTKPADMVNHPPHYTGFGDLYEPIKVLEAWLTPEEFIGFLKGNALKYQARHRQKGGNEDLAKSKWYSDYLTDFLKRTGIETRKA